MIISAPVRPFLRGIAEVKEITYFITSPVYTEVVLRLRCSFPEYFIHPVVRLFSPRKVRLKVLHRMNRIFAHQIVLSKVLPIFLVLKCKILYGVGCLRHIQKLLKRSTGTERNIYLSAHVRTALGGH